MLQNAAIFSATFACVRCRLRFARRARCPWCGGAEIISLTTAEGRARYGGAPVGRGGRGVLIGAGIAAMVPAVAGLSIGPSIVQSVIAGAGALLVAVTLLAKRGTRERRRARVFLPSDEARGDTTLTGIARRASVEIESALTQSPCLLYGVFGEAGDADVADADGGDFDLELPSGERVMISLEHAMLVGGAPDRAGEGREGQGQAGRALAELLENRGIPGPAGRPVLDELVVRDGEEVTVIGTLLGGTVTSFGDRGGSGARVLAGDEHRLLLVRRAR